MIRDPLQAAEKNPDGVLWYCGQQCQFFERSREGQWKQYDLKDVWNFSSPDTNCMFHRSSIFKVIKGWDEDCRWLEDWDFFLRAFLAFPESCFWVPGILVNYRQVHGQGADGLCAEAREQVVPELQGREYLIQKWMGSPGFSIDRFRKSAGELRPFRA